MRGRSWSTKRTAITPLMRFTTVKTSLRWKDPRLARTGRRLASGVVGPTTGRRRGRRIRSLPVSTWKAFEQAEPGFAARVRTLFEAGRHKTIATLRADGSPRISGVECEFEDG